jgi:hypothetical protein
MVRSAVTMESLIVRLPVQLFADPGKASRKSSLEIQRLEAQMHHNSLLHKKAFKDRERHVAQLRACGQRKAAANAALQEEVASLGELLDEQMPLLDTSSHDFSASRCAHDSCVLRSLQLRCTTFRASITSSRSKGVHFSTPLSAPTTAPSPRALANIWLAAGIRV